MAFIPDNSYDLRLKEKLNPLLWEFYQYLCRQRRHETRLCPGTVDEFIGLYGYKRASKFLLLKLLKTTRWIGGMDGAYELWVGDFSPVDKKADARRAEREQSKKIDLFGNQSKNLDSESKKSDESSKKSDSHIRNNQPYQQPAGKQDISSAHEAFEVLPDEDFLDTEHAEKQNELLLWLRQIKNVKNIPQHDWVKLFAELEAESITLDGFKEFYVWVGNLDWIVEKKVAITPNVMRGQIEGYKNREHFENKRLIRQQKGSENGTNSQHLTVADRRSQSAVDEYQAVEQLRIAAEQRRRKPASANNVHGSG